MLVEVKPLPKTRWHGKKGKDSFTVPKVVEVLFDTATGRYATGMSETEEAEYSKRLSVNLTSIWNPAEPHPYYSTKQASIILPNYTLVLNTEKPYEYVKIRNIKASKLVANSMREWEEGKWPDATHVIFDEEGEVDVKAAKLAMEEECTVLASGLTDEDRINILTILDEKSYKGRSPNFLRVAISDVIKEKPDQFLKYARIGKEGTAKRAAVLQAIFAGILNQDAAGISYTGDFLGNNLEQAVEFLDNPKNQKYRVSILEKLQNKKV